MILSDKDLMKCVFDKTNVILDGWWKNLAYNSYDGSPKGNNEVLNYYRTLNKNKEEELKGKL